MSETLRFDLVVVGTGEGGQTAADSARQAGKRVAIIDELPFGGTCALRGCNPKRVLAGAAETLARVEAMQGKGIEGKCAIDWPSLVTFERHLLEGIPERTEASYREKGIATFHGHCEFVEPKKVRVDDLLLQFEHMVIASGARPRTLGIEGEELMSTSDEFLAMERLPERILFVGAGYISFELAHVTARAGAKVRMVELLPSALAGFDPDLVNMLLEASRRIGIEIYVNTRVRKIERDGDVLKVYAGEERGPQFEADMVVHGAGRVPALEALRPEKGGIPLQKGRIEVNQYLQSVENPAVYVAGDALGQGPQLTPVAEMEGRVAGRNIVEGNRSFPDYRVVPSVAFTMPPIASVGMQEKAARGSDREVNILYRDTSNRHITRRHGLSHSGMKVITEKATGQILGAHLLGHNADEVINFFALAMARRLSIQDISDVITTFPSVTYDALFRIR